MCIRFLSEPSLYWQSIWSSSKKWCWNGFAILPAVLVLCVGNSVCISAQHGYHFANFWFTACIPALYVLQESTWRTNITIIIHHFIRNFNTIGVPLKGLEISAQGDAYRLTRLFFFIIFIFIQQKSFSTSPAQGWEFWLDLWIDQPGYEYHVCWRPWALPGINWSVCATGQSTSTTRVWKCMETGDL